jgi:hypothetical protein
LARYGRQMTATVYRHYTRGERRTPGEEVSIHVSQPIAPSIEVRPSGSHYFPKIQSDVLTHIADLRYKICLQYAQT